jgi:hypothetical protein
METSRQLYFLFILYCTGLVAPSVVMSVVPHMMLSMRTVAGSWDDAGRVEHEHERNFTTNVPDIYIICTQRT